ncbi:MAG TPA: TetR/AcrR family transcriptional regulator [Acidimicrobiales bacterium]|nr:TetR/AcrR family transcriptional regulator [Acidimicrobiales bacterium]
MAAQPDSHPRQQILDAALRLLEAGGPEAVQARKLAAEIGASTMAVYTHFGGMAGLFEAIVREGFTRFAAHVAATPTSDDPMADFFVQGMAYRQWALANRQLYRLIFGMSDASIPSRVSQDMTLTGTISPLPEGQAGFAVMTDSLERIQHAGQIAAPDTVAAAGQFLAATHGYVLLEMAGYFGPDSQGFATVLGPMSISLMIGLGATKQTVDKSITAALLAVDIG